MKKHENRFSVVFNKIDEQQAHTIEILNNLPPQAIALYLSRAVCAYERRSSANKSPQLADKPKRRPGRPRNRTAEVELTAAAESASRPASLNISSKTEAVSSFNSNPETVRAADSKMLASMIDFLGEA